MRQPDTYERFGYRCTEQELDGWAACIRNLADDAELTDVLFNYCYRNYAQANARHLADPLGA